MAANNPIIPGFNPDPSIVRVGVDYFLTTSTFEYFPGLPVYHSRDLMTWSLIGHGLSRPSQLHMRTVESGGGVFAPTIRYHKNRFYIACCAMYRVPNMDNFHKGLIGPRGFYISTDDIWSNSWGDPVYFDTIGIDQDLFFDDDDRVYLSLTTKLPKELMTGGFGFGVYVLEVDMVSGRSLSKPLLIRQSSHGRRIAEGSHIFKKDGWYYLLTAEGGTEVDHQEWIFRSKQGPFGPWEEPPHGVNPILHNGDHPDIQQTGHLDLVEGHDGQWWGVFLAVRGFFKNGEHEWSQLGRETYIAPVTWVNGWPEINQRKPIELSPSVQAADAKVTRSYDFDSQRPLALDGWYHLRTPVAQDYSLTLRPNSLALYGTPYTLELDECPAMLLQKQIGFEGQFQATLDCLPDDGEEAGVVVWYSRGAYATLSLRGSVEGTKLVLRYSDKESDEPIIQQSPAPQGKIQLIITASRLSYQFQYRDENGSLVPVDTISWKHIVKSRKTDSKNVGTHLGLFAQSLNDWPCLKPAFFSDCSWASSS